MNTRKHYIDTAKALGIIAVVAGHAPGVHHSLVSFIYSFHMPLFFFLSGYLLRPDKLRLSVVGHLRLQWQNLALPYLVFFCDFILLLDGRGPGHSRSSGFMAGDKSIAGYARGQYNKSEGQYRFMVFSLPDRLLDPLPSAAYIAVDNNSQLRCTRHRHHGIDPEGSTAIPSTLGPGYRGFRSSVLCARCMRILVNVVTRSDDS